MTQLNQLPGPCPVLGWNGSGRRSPAGSSRPQRTRAGDLSLRHSALSAVYGRGIHSVRLAWGFAAAPGWPGVAGVHPAGAGPDRASAACRLNGSTAQRLNGGMMAGFGVGKAKSALVLGDYAVTTPM